MTTFANPFQIFTTDSLYETMMSGQISRISDYFWFL